MSDTLVGLLNFRQNSSLFGGGGGVTVGDLTLLQSAVAQLDLLTPRIKSQPVQVATLGQTIFTLPEPYVMGSNSLLVFSGSVLADDYTELSATQIQFNSPRELGERIKVIEIQIGSDTGTTVVDTLPSTSFLAGEIPAGVINGTNGSDGNGTFTVAFDVDPAVTPRLFIGGGMELLPVMFTRLLRVFTILAPYKPTVGEVLAIYYRRGP